MSETAVRVVHLVAKTHLDLGFTALASEVTERYLHDFFPRAIEVADELSADEPGVVGLGVDGRGDGHGGVPAFVWTTGSWMLREVLDRHPDAEMRARAQDAVRRGVLAWHAMPFTTHTELLDVAVLRHGLSISAELDRRFGRRTTAAKLTDVPGHTRAMVPLLAEARVAFLHIGVNPAWPVPEVPPVFRWRAPGGSEVVVAVSAGGYGDEVVVEGCDAVLAFHHSGDNLGPPDAEEVREVREELARRHPGAEIRASTLGGFADALLASGAIVDLPVVTAEIGDPWLFGIGSDPQKVAVHRRLLDVASRLRPHLGVVESGEIDDRLLLVAEHTWGLDQKLVFAEEPAWDDRTLARLRTEPAGRRFEASWNEQRRYLDDAATLLRGAAERYPDAGVDPATVQGVATDTGTRSLRRTDGFGRLGDGADPADTIVPIPGSWRLGIDPVTGAVNHLERDDGVILADPQHPLGTLSHRRFSEADYDRFLAGLAVRPHDLWWAIRDNTKPGIDAAGAVSDRLEARPIEAHWWPPDDRGRAELRITLGFPEGRSGAPTDIVSIWTWSPDSRDPALEQRLIWGAKPATRLPEATWLGWHPVVADTRRWRIEKLGSLVDPHDVVRRGGRGLHAVGSGGLTCPGSSGTVRLTSPDAPLAAPGGEHLLDPDPPAADLSTGWWLLLHDNCWGTNFPMWNEGSADLRFRLHLDPS